MSNEALVPTAKPTPKWTAAEPPPSSGVSVGDFANDGTHSAASADFEWTAAVGESPSDDGIHFAATDFEWTAAVGESPSAADVAVPLVLELPDRYRADAKVAHNMGVEAMNAKFNAPVSVKMIPVPLPSPKPPMPPPAKL